MTNTILQQVELLINSNKFYPAKKILIDSIKKSPLNTDFWGPLANIYLNQGLIRESYEIYSYLLLLYPKDATYKKILDKIYPFLDNAKPQVTYLKELLDLDYTTVTIATIFKNEIQTIEKWYHHIQNKVDQIVAVDTGSSDGTREFLETKNDVIIVDFPWNDNFADARNAAKDSITSKWVLWIDTDEYLIDTINSLNAVRFVAEYYETLGTNPILQPTLINIIDGMSKPTHEIARMYSTQSYIFKGRIHEQIIPLHYNLIERNYVGIILEHTGYDTPSMLSKDKLKRNLKLLELSLDDTPNDPATLFYLGRESRLLGQFNDALNYLEQAKIRMYKFPNFSLKLDVYINLIITKLNLNLLEEAEKDCNQALQIDSNFPDVIFYLNTIKSIKAHNLLDTVYLSLINFEKHVFDYQGNTETEPVILNEKTPLLLAEIFISKGQLIDAYKTLQSIPQQYLSDSIIKRKQFIEQQFLEINRYFQ